MRVYNMSNIIKFPITEEDYGSMPITPEFLMEFCEEFEIDSIEEFMSIFDRVLSEVSIELGDEEDPTPTIPENTIYPKLVVEFLEEHNVRCDEDMEEFSQMINLLTAEPNTPLLVIN